MYKGAVGEALHGIKAEGLLELLVGCLSFGVPGQRLGFLPEHGSEGAEKRMKF